MRKKEIIWIGMLLVLGGIYIHYFSHWFEKREMVITASLRPNRRGNAAIPLLIFTLNGDYRLTKLKVIPLDGEKFNPMTPPVWNLDSDSNSVPTRAIRYGQRIHGMKPVLKAAQADPLTPGVTYRLLVTAGNVSGSNDFRMPEATE